MDEAGGEAAGSAIQVGAAAAVKAGDGTLLFLILCSGDYMRVFPGMPRAVPGIGIPRISCNRAIDVDLYIFPPRHFFPDERN